MRDSVVLVLTFCICSLQTGLAVECESGWMAFKDEACIKIFEELLSHHDASLFCASKGNSVSTASMVTVKDSAMQELLINYTQSIHEQMWLGGKYDNTFGQFIWHDGDLLTYKNWAEGYPRNLTDSETCILLNPVNSKTLNQGKWEDGLCDRRNRVLCQRTVTWTLEDATREILKLRKENREFRSQFEIANAERNELRQQFQDMNARVVPVGSIYVEYYNQPSPLLLWSTLQWEDVTSSYAGLFFRAFGGNSELWGEVQTSCAPSISHVNYGATDTPTDFVTLVELQDGGWSPSLSAGSHFPMGNVRWNEFLRFHKATCEVRPTNQAVRIWKRLA